MKKSNIPLAIIALVGILILGWQVAWANCTGCGEDGHQMCPVEEDKHVEVVFAVCVFADGQLIDHKGADNMSACLKTKREVTKKWRSKAATTNTIEINGIEYQIDGDHLAFMCDKVDAHVHRYSDGSWEIVEILGKHGG